MYLDYTYHVRCEFHGRCKLRVPVREYGRLLVDPFSAWQSLPLSFQCCVVAFALPGRADAHRRALLLLQVLLGRDEEAGC